MTNDTNEEHALIAAIEEELERLILSDNLTESEKVRRIEKAREILENR